jgi:FkbM family methyltransferase
MQLVEKICSSLRHSGVLSQADWLWDRVRPSYDKVLAFKGRRGLERVINGTDRVLVTPDWRSVPEIYEPEVWHSLMAEVTAGDVVADVGVYVGLYSVALAQHVGPEGRVVAFEPDPSNCETARQHVLLNGVGDRVEFVQAAVGAKAGRVAFGGGADTGHVLASTSDDHARTVACVTLDDAFAQRRLDILKVDVEGYEEMVLQGARQLLNDPARSPRALYIEVHPYAWHDLGTTSDSLLTLLADSGYRVMSVNEEPVTRIEAYGEIIARKNTRA